LEGFVQAVAHEPSAVNASAPQRFDLSDVDGDDGVEVGGAFDDD
jgi:hypothetical protein